MMFLGIIGGSGGWLAAERQKQHEAAVTVHTSSPAPPASPSPSPDASPSPSPDASPTAGTRRCPSHTEDVAKMSPLYEVLYIQTAKSEAWICQDGSGTLYYQGHRGKPGEALVEGTNALFLTGVVQEGDAYVATNNDNNGTTQYVVTAKQLVRKVNGVPGQPEAVQITRP
jgi:hypothetical protein